MVEARADFTWLRQRRARLGPKKLSDRPNTTRQSANAPARFDRMPVNGAAEVQREQLDPLQDAGVARPQELVGLGAPQHVELARALAEGGADRQRHQHQPDALGLRSEERRVGKEW